MMFKISVLKLTRTWMAILLMFAFALGVAMQVHAAGNAIDVNASVSKKCVNLPPAAGGPNDKGTSKNPRLCTPTPTNAPPSTATLTYTPTVTATPTATATATSTPTDTASPTNTATATSTPTDTATTTNTATATNTPTTVPPASITVYNTGGFFVQYYVSYSLPNAPLQSLYSGVFNVNQGVTLTLPGDATNVGILIQHYTGITGWQTACTRSYTQARSVVIIVSGTPFFASCTGG